MTGKIKKAIDDIISIRSNGNATLASTTKTKLFLKGINTETYTAESPDDPQVLQKIQQVATEFGINLTI